MRNPEFQRFLLRLACLLPLLGGLVAIDWAAMQQCVRRRFTGTLDEAAEELVSGKTICSLIDVFDLKPVWIEHLHTHPDVVILGASRVVQIPQEWFGQRKVLNAALPGGDLTDFVSIFEECLETGKTPRTVLLELNPSLTFEGKDRVPPALIPYFRRMARRYGIYSPLLFSRLFTLDAVRWDFQIWQQPPFWKVSRKPDPIPERVRPDGTMEWKLAEPGRSADEVEQSAIFNMHHLQPQFQHWRTSSKPGKFDRKILEAFLDDLHSRGIRVITLLVPVHPAAYDFYVRQGGYDETWIRQEMASRGITVIGSYCPSAAKATRDDFFDDVHVYPELLHRMLAESGVVE